MVTTTPPSPRVTRSFSIYECAAHRRSRRAQERARGVGTGRRWFRFHIGRLVDRPQTLAEPGGPGPIRKPPSPRRKARATRAGERTPFVRWVRQRAICCLMPRPPQDDGDSASPRRVMLTPLTPIATPRVSFAVGRRASAVAELGAWPQFGRSVARPSSNES
jgi:hypothetical protein